MNNKLRLKRLTKLVKILESIPPKKFNLSHWYEEDALDRAVRAKLPTNFINIDCRTTACALGWAALDKSFNRAGLGLEIDEDGMGYVTCKGRKHCDAGAVFFGITGDESQGLFLLEYEGEKNYPTKKWEEVTPGMVACKVRMLVEKYKLRENK